MNCAAARLRMLEADLEELRAASEREDTSSALAAHLSTCAECRGRARRLLVGVRALARVLDRIPPRLDADRAVALVSGAAARRPRWPGWRILAPVAAAAVIAVVVTQADRGAVRDDGARMVAARAEALRVDVPAGRNAAVLETSNPDIIVVWFY